MSRPASLKVNGQTREYAADSLPATIRDLVESLGLDPAGVVAEVNGDLVKRGDLAKHALADGDTVEIVRLVGGG